MIRDELLARGYSAELLDMPVRMTKFTSPRGGTWITRNATIAYPFCDYAVHKFTADKNLSYEFALRQGVSVPETLSLTEMNQAGLQFLARFGTIVVKPRDSFGSRGLTLDVSAPESLAPAIALARQFSSEVLLQKQLVGDEIRITVIRGKAVSVMLRQTPRVTGDGTSTVSDLIRQENEARKQLDFEYITYPLLEEPLVPSRYINDPRVPAKGEVLELNKSTLIRGGASMYEISDNIHESYLKTAERLARSLNPAFLVVDLMVQDYTSPQTDNNYAFLEFNTSPSLRLYYGLRGGKAYDIVRTLADMIEKRVDA